MTSLTREMIAEYLDYNPETGALIWTKRVGQRIRVGQEAGRIENNGRRSITLFREKYTGAQIAWLLHYGEFPGTVIKFVDGDVSNLRIKNLINTGFKGRQRSNISEYGNPQDDARNRDLRKFYGFSLKKFREMEDAQNGVCSICKKPESYAQNGKVKPLSVDHCHASGNVRELLCAACNHMLGNARDNSETLRAAADYLDRHAVPAGDLTHV